MSAIFDNFPTPLLPHQHHHHHNMNAVHRSLTMPAPASQVHNFPSLPNQQQQQQSQSSQSQSTQTTTFAQAPQDPKKRHACPTCSRAFTTSGHLARHIRVHTGERNHKCPFPGCETRCSRQDNLQQHYRIHLSPGSRRSSSTRARAEAKKKTSLSTSSTLPLSPVSAPRSALLHDEPPDSPPPLARATVLPSLHHRSSYNNGTAMMSHERSDQIPNHHHNQGRAHSSASASAPASASGSGSSAGSPHSYASATASPEISPHIPPTSTAGVNGSAGTAAAYGNLLGLSHERQHSPSAGEYHSYSSSYAHTTSNGHVYPHHPHRQLSTENYAMSSSSSPYSNGASQPEAPSSFAHTLPPIQSLDSTNGNSSFGLGRISQQPAGPYHSYETYATASNGHAPSNWSAPESSYAHHHQHPQHNHPSHHNAWWSQNNVNVGVSVGPGTQRGYQSYATS